jgi:hypothetical protein
MADRNHNGRTNDEGSKPSPRGKLPEIGKPRMEHRVLTKEIKPANSKVAPNS